MESPGWGPGSFRQKTGPSGWSSKMGNVVRFNRARRPISRHSGPPLEGKILMFTGVHYERNKTSPPDTDGPNAGKKPVSKSRRSRG